MAEHNTLAGALAAAQGALKNPERNKPVEVRTKDGRSYTFRYATLDHITDTIRQTMKDNGLAWSSTIENRDGHLFCVTRLMHAGGESLECPVPIGTYNGRMQDFGSNLTYARRYGLTLLLGIAADEDDDNNIASGNYYEEKRSSPPPRQQRQAAPAPAPAPGPAVPETPGRIPTPTDPTNRDLWAGWAKALLAAVRSTKTLDECSEWLMHNGGALAEYGKINEEAMKAVNTKIAQHRKTLESAPQEAPQEAAE